MNKVILTGNLTKDPESRTTSSNVAVCNFTIAVQRKFKNENGESESDFINIIVWRGLADNCSKYLTKGSKVGVVGSLQTRTYETTDGQKRFVTEVVADEVEFLNTKKAEEQNGGSKTSGKNETVKFEPIDDDHLPF